MPVVPWSTDMTVALVIPPEFRDRLSFSAGGLQPELDLVAPEPLQVEDNPSQTTFTYTPALHMRSPGAMALHARATLRLSVVPKFPNDPGWEPPADADDYRYNSGADILLFNPPDVLTDGTVMPFTVTVGVDYSPGWGNLVKAFRLELAENKRVLIGAHELMDIDSGVWAVLIGPDGRERAWFGNYGFTPVSLNTSLTAGVYMILAGVANVYRHGNPSPYPTWDCTLTVTLSDPPVVPLLVTTRTGWFRTGMESTSQVRNWGILYQFDAPYTGAYSFYMSGSFDTFLAVADDAGNLLAQNDDYGNSNSRIDGLNLIGGKSYFVSASSYGQGATGAYAVGVEHPTAAAGSVPSVTGFKLSTLAGGTNNAGYVDGPYGTNRLVAPGAAVYVPGEDTVYVLENGGMRKISRAGVVSPFIGAASGYDGKSLNGPVASAKLSAYGNDMVLGPDGALYFTDQVPSIRRVKDGQVSTYAGPNWTLQSIDGINATKTNMDTGEETVVNQAANQTQGHVDGSRLDARFTDPQGLAFDADGNLWVADDCYIRKITPDGTVSTPFGCPGPDGVLLLNANHGVDGRGNVPCVAADPDTAPTVALAAQTQLYYDPAKGEGACNGVSYAYAFVDEHGVESGLSPWSAEVFPTVASAGTGLWNVTPVEVTLPADAPGALKQVIYAQMSMGGSTKIGIYRIVRDHTHALVTDYFSEDWLTVLRGAPAMAGIADVLAALPRGGARFKRVQGLCTAPGGVLWAVDEGLGRIVRIANGVASTVADGGRKADPFTLDGQGACSAIPPGLLEIPPFHYDDAPTVQDSGSPSQGLGMGEFLATVVIVMPDGVETLAAPVTRRLPQVVPQGGSGYEASSQHVYAPFIPSGCQGWRVYYRMAAWSSFQPWLRGPLMGPSDSVYDVTLPYADQNNVTQAKTGLPTTCRGQATVEPIGCYWDNVRKVLLFTDYNNILRSYNPHTGWVRCLIGDDWHATRADNQSGQGDGFIYHSTNSPFYIKPAWDANTFLVDDWYGQTVRVLEHGTWTLPQTLPQGGTPQPITSGETVEGVFLLGEALRNYTITLQAGQVLSVKMFYLDACWPGATVYDPTDTQVTRDGFERTQVGWADIAYTETFTAAQGGTFTVRIEPEVLQNAPPAPWPAAFLSRFKFQVTVV